jgi:hypothetical protein
MKTNGPTLVTACRQRRVTSSPESVPSAGEIQAPPDVSSITVLVPSSTCNQYRPGQVCVVCVCVCVCVCQGEGVG